MSAAKMIEVSVMPDELYRPFYARRQPDDGDWGNYAMVPEEMVLRLEVAWKEVNETLEAIDAYLGTSKRQVNP